MSGYDKSFFKPALMFPAFLSKKSKSTTQSHITYIIYNIYIHYTMIHICILYIHTSILHKYMYIVYIWLCIDLFTPHPFPSFDYLNTMVLSYFSPPLIFFFPAPCNRNLVEDMALDIFLHQESQKCSNLFSWKVFFFFFKFP